MAMTDQERLSEQANMPLRINVLAHMRACIDEDRDVNMDANSAALVVEYIERLARQLTEAERENGELRKLLLEAHGWMDGVYPKPAAPFLAAVLDAALNTGEAPASPPKSSSGEALDTGGSEG